MVRTASKCTTHARVTGSFTPGERSNMEIFTVPNNIVVVEKGLVPKNTDYVIIPEGVTTISEGAFAGLRNLRSVFIPKSVRKIGTAAFRGCKSLKIITLPPGVSSIEDYTFYECINLRVVNVPTSVKRIGNYAFSKCINVRNINIPDEVVEIGRLAFAGDANLTIFIDQCIERKTGKYAFVCCKITGYLED